MPDTATRVADASLAEPGTWPEIGPLRVLLVIGHPRAGSLSAALAAAYRAGAEAAGAKVRTLDLAALAFDPDVGTPHVNDQPREPAVEEARRLIVWCRHLVLVYPTWWGLFPARLKGLFDRALTPGFGFEEADTPSGYRPLLGGRTAHLVTTMDTPGPVYRLVYGRPGHRALAAATLGFCGIGPTRVTAFGPVRTSDAARRQAWLDQARDEGRRLAGSDRDPAARRVRRLGGWLRACRLQFHPMAWAAYAAGSLHAAGAGGPDWGLFLLGLSVLFLLELGVVFTNELVDLPSDRMNARAGPFNGGSRVLVEGRLRPADLVCGAVAVLASSAAAALWLLTLVDRPWAVGLWLAGLALLALSYSLPPGRLSWRTLGEPTVALTHSFGVLAAGHLVQGGAPGAAWPWLVSLPLALAILPPIILANVPDREADAAVGKRTVPVRFGTVRALRLAGLAVLASALVAVPLALAGVEGLRLVPLFAVPHGILLLVLLRRAERRVDESWRLTPAIVASLVYLLWFVALPLAAVA